MPALTLCHLLTHSLTKYCCRCQQMPCRSQIFSVSLRVHRDGILIKHTIKRTARYLAVLSIQNLQICFVFSSSILFISQDNCISKHGKSKLSLLMVLIFLFWMSTFYYRLNESMHTFVLKVIFFELLKLAFVVWLNNQNFKIYIYIKIH